MTEVYEAPTAEGVINSTVEEKGHQSAESVISTVEQKKKLLPEQEQQKVVQYVTGMRESVRGSIVNDLEPRVAGQCDGSEIEIATTTMQVHYSIEQTLAHAEEVGEHERYHLDNGHSEGMQAGSSANGPYVVTMGGQNFDRRGLIEGITVSATGNQFVSEEYKGFERMVESAAASAGLSMEQVENAVNVKKDLSLIDDLDRGRVEEPQFAQGI